MFIAYTLLILVFTVLGIVGGFAGLVIIGVGGLVMSGLFRYNQVNEQDKRSDTDILLKEIRDLKEKAEQDTSGTSDTSGTTDDNIDNEHSHGTYSHRHPNDFPTGIDTGDIITSSDSDKYGICDDGDPLYKKYLKRYNLLDFGTSGFNIPEDTGIKKIKVTFAPHVMNEHYNMNNGGELSGMIRSGDPTAEHPNNLPGVDPSLSPDSPYRADIENGIVTINQVQLIEQTVGKYATDSEEYDTDGLTDIAPNGTLKVYGGTTETTVNSHEFYPIGGKHVTPKNMIDGDLNTFYFGGMTKDNTTTNESDGFSLTLSVAKTRNDLASFVIYTPIAGCLKGAYLHLLNGRDEPLTEQPIPFPSGRHTIYEFSFGALGGQQYVSNFLNEQNKPDLYYHVRENIGGRVAETRQEYAQSHFRSNPNNKFNCDAIDSESSSEGFITSLNNMMFGPTNNDVARTYNVKPIASDLIK
jgi:hypothetical protein